LVTAPTIKKQKWTLKKSEDKYFYLLLLKEKFITTGVLMQVTVLSDSTFQITL
jgi:hypothetical protein